MGHLARCRTLWSTVERLTGIPMHNSMSEFMCLVQTPVTPGASKKNRGRPPSAVMRVAVGCDAYHKIAGAARQGRIGSGVSSEHRLVEAVKHARRRLRCL